MESIEQHSSKYIRNFAGEDLEHIESHTSGADKGGCPHGHGNLVGAMQPLEGVWIVKLSLGSIVWRHRFHLIQVTTN